MKIGLYDLLPLIIRLRDAEASGQGSDDPILKRIVGAVQDETDIIVALIEGIQDLISPSSTTDLILSLLSNYLGSTEFPFSSITADRRNYVATLSARHRIKGTVLSILKERAARAIAAGTYIHELYKWELNAVDEYVVSPDEAPYSTAYRAARVVFIAGDEPGLGEPLQSDGLDIGVFAVDQIGYGEAKDFRRRLNNVFPINVLIPPPVDRTEFEDQVSSSSDDIAATVYVLFEDRVTSQEDELVIQKQCQSGCQLSCQERCEVLCEFTCETTCESTCQAQCENNCQATCQFFCEASCEQGCQDACQSFCQGSCQSECQTDCEYSCQQQCQSGCQSSGESCQSYCETNCQFDVEVVCTDACQFSCQSSAQDPCDGGPPASEGVIV